MMRGFLGALDAMLDGLSPRRVLEVGVGEGEVMTRLLDRFPDVPMIGLDLPDPELASHWRSADIACLFGDGTALPFADDAFDLVLAIEVLEHVPGPDAALRELSRVCSGHADRVGAARADLAGREPPAAPLRAPARQHARATSTTGRGVGSAASSAVGSTSNR